MQPYSHINEIVGKDCTVSSFFSVLPPLVVLEVLEIPLQVHCDEIFNADIFLFSLMSPVYGEYTWDLCIYVTQRSVGYRYNLLLLYLVIRWLEMLQ